MAKPLIVEFPPKTVEVIDSLASTLKLSREEVISRALGLLEIWVQARKQDPPHILVERPEKGEGEETQIEIGAPGLS